MTMTYRYAKAKQNFDLVLRRASTDGKVKIQQNTHTFIVTPAPTNVSPLDVKGVAMNITSKDIVSFIHESRKR
jgi:hypothetical protein